MAGHGASGPRLSVADTRQGGTALSVKMTMADRGTAVVVSGDHALRTIGTNQ